MHEREDRPEGERPARLGWQREDGGVIRRKALPGLLLGHASLEQTKALFLRARLPRRRRNEHDLVAALGERPRERQHRTEVPLARDAAHQHAHGPIF